MTMKMFLVDFPIGAKQTIVYEIMLGQLAIVRIMYRLGGPKVSFHLFAF